MKRAPLGRFGNLHTGLMARAPQPGLIRTVIGGGLIVVVTVYAILFAVVSL